jgi:hypothetical protein
MEKTSQCELGLGLSGECVLALRNNIFFLPKMVWSRLRLSSDYDCWWLVKRYALRTSASKTVSIASKILLTGAGTSNVEDKAYER